MVTHGASALGQNPAYKPAHHRTTARLELAFVPPLPAHSPLCLPAPVHESRGMDRQRLSSLAHAEHPIAAPVDEQRASQLLGRLRLPAGASALDLGCGQGAWLIRLAAVVSGVRLTGVDTSSWALGRAEEAADQLGCGDLIEWVHGDAASTPLGVHDAVLCVGASHIFGGLDGTLSAVRERLEPGGQVVLGDGIWEQPPSQLAMDALEAEPGDFPDIAGLVRRIRQHGFEVEDGHISTLQEWDDYEWAWTGALVRWAIEQPEGTEDRAAALGAAREHRDAWLGGYRRHLGFATLVLVDILDRDDIPARHD
jgi:SAM-dependent methyltransferase